MRRLSVVSAAEQIFNPALKPLEFLIGSWWTTGTHPQMPGETLHGWTSFAWHEGGAFLIMRSKIADPQFPSGLAIIGSDDVAGNFAMTYFDESGFSRIFDVTVGDRTVAWRREDAMLSQSMTIRAEDRGDRLVSQGRMSRDGAVWSDDLSQTYVRRG